MICFNEGGARVENIEHVVTLHFRICNDIIYHNMVVK